MLDIFLISEGGYINNAFSALGEAFQFEKSPFFSQLKSSDDGMQIVKSNIAEDTILSVGEWSSDFDDSFEFSESIELKNGIKGYNGEFFSSPTHTTLSFDNYSDLQPIVDAPVIGDESDSEGGIDINIYSTEFSTWTEELLQDGNTADIIILKYEKITS